MEELVKELSKCPVCSAITPDNRKELIKSGSFKIKEYKKGEVIARQGDQCRYLYILLKGVVEAEMVTDTGSHLSIEIIKAPKPLASAFLFAEDNSFPVDVIVVEDSKVLMVPKEEIIALFQKDLAFLQRYITFNSNKTQFLSHKLQLLTIKTIKGKLAHYILEQLSLCHSISPTINTFYMDKNQTQLASYFGVSRPALARTLAEIEESGAITYSRNKVSVLNKKLLQNMLS